MAVTDNLVYERSSSTGAGNFTLTSVVGKQSFNTAFGTGGTDVFFYFISNLSANEWEVGTGHLSAATTLVRDTVIASTNAGSLVVFSAGTKDVTSDIPADLQARLGAAMSVNGITEPQFQIYADDGVTQANITATTYDVDGGGIFHGNFARGTSSSPSAAQAGDITGGIGSRPYLTSEFANSSPAAIHWVAAENMSSAARGMYMRFLTTPKGSATRAERMIIGDDGTIFVPVGSGFDPTSSSHLRPLGEASGGQITIASGSTTQNAAFVAVGINNNAGYRAAVAGGTVATPTATPSGTYLCFLTGSGHDGTSWGGSRALIGSKAAETFSSVAQGAYVSIEATQIGGTTRTEVGRFSVSTSAGATGLMLWDVDNGTLEQVTVGSSDSGGAGFKVLRIPN